MFSRAGVPRLSVAVPRQVCGYLTVGDPEGSGHLDVPDVPANELTSLPATCGHAARTRSHGPCTACDRSGLSSIIHTHTRPFIFSKPKMGLGDFVPRKKSGSEQFSLELSTIKGQTGSKNQTDNGLPDQSKGYETLQA